MNSARFIRNDADTLVGKTFESLVEFPRVPVLQRDYYEHIIRNERE